MCTVMLIRLLSNFTSFVEENNPKLMPSIAFSILKVPTKCVDGRSSAQVPTGGASALPRPPSGISGEGKGIGKVRKGLELGRERKGMEGKGRGWRRTVKGRRGWNGKGREEKGRNKGKGKGSCPAMKSWIRHWSHTTCIATARKTGFTTTAVAVRGSLK